MLEFSGDYGQTNTDNVFDNILRYLDTFTEQAEIDIQVMQGEIERLEQELAQVRTEMAVLLQGVGV